MHLQHAIENGHATGVQPCRQRAVVPAAWQVRRLICRCLVRLYAVGDTLPLYSRVASLQAFLGSKASAACCHLRKHNCSSNYHASCDCTMLSMCRHMQPAGWWRARSSSRHIRVCKDERDHVAADHRRL